MTVTINHTWYCNFGNGTTTGYYAVGKWTAGATVTAGQLIRQNATPTLGNERVFVCIIAGTSAAVTEPTWVVTKGAKTVDGSATWMECTGQPAVNSDAVNTPLSSQNRSGIQVLGSIIANNAGTYYFICTAAGTTGAGEPTYVTTAGSTTTDSICTWTCIGAVENYGGWSAPFARISSPSTNLIAAGDNIYVSAAHQETGGSGPSLGTPSSLPNCFYCVVQNCNFPPQSTDLTTGASVTSLPGSGLGINLNGDMNGFTFTMGTGNSSLPLNVGGTGGKLRLFNCVLNTSGSGSSQVSIVSSGNIEWYNVRYTTAANQGITLGGASFVWRDTPAFNPGGVTPALFTGVSGYSPTVILIEGVDLSLTGITTLMPPNPAANKVVCSGCKFPASWIPTATTLGGGASQIDYLNCDFGGAVYRHERWWFEGSQTTDTTVVQTSGASDGVTALSWKTSVSATGVWQHPFECMPISIWWTSATGPTGTITLQGAFNGAALPYNDQIWMDVRYFGTAGSTLLVSKSGTKANFLATHTQYSASTAAWDSVAVTRTNNTVYAVGGVFRLSSNPGQLFYCTTAGTTGYSQPAAYTGVADGTLVTDGSAVFRPIIRFSMTMTLSPLPQTPGFIRCYVRAGLPSSVFWIDPVLTLS